MKVLCSLVLCTGVALGEVSDWQKVLAKKVYEKNGVKLVYRSGAVGGGEKLPLVLFLHGAGERGGDNSAQLKHGVRDLITWCEQEKMACRILVPQCPENQWWSNLDGDYKNPEDVKMNVSASAVMERVFEVVDSLVDGGGVDTDRIYVTGLSMGGYGTFDAVCRRPRFFAAAMPVCGGGDPAQAPVIKDVPLWVFHGGMDKVVPPEMSRAMVEAVKRAGGNPVYREYPEIGHGSWSATYSNPEVWKWLFKQAK